MTLHSILREEARGVDPDEIRTSRRRSIVIVRQRYFYRAMAETGRTATEIGAVLGVSGQGVAWGAVTYAERNGMRLPRPIATRWIRR